MTRPREFTAGFLFCGLGAGALGFLQGEGRLGPDRGKFRSLGGIDNDANACTDFELITKSPSWCTDLSSITPAALKARWGERRPDAIFTSPPCKGFSGLLSKARAAEPKYQELNTLVFKGLFLVCETWSEVPPLIVLENVPKIQTRGAELLSKARQLLARYGYVFHEGTHDCGEVGGLAQHRRRYLLVARQPKAVTAYVYKPPKLRVRGCGEVLGSLPMPSDPDAGALHTLPKISWLNWVRLALIPAGGDWRDLPKAITPEQAGSHQSKFRVTDWDKAMGTIIGADSLGSGAPSVADPRLNLADARLLELVQLGRAGQGADSFKGRPGLFGVNGWDEPMPTVTGRATVSGGTTVAAVADPRLTSPVPEGAQRRSIHARYDLRPWDAPARAVTGPGVNGGYGVADPRLVEAVQLGCAPRAGTYGVMGWHQAAATVTGSVSIDNGSAAVADPRDPKHRLPVIVAEDGTWHRPLTTMEFAALQELPTSIDGKPLQLAGKSSSAWRERIGNAVPVKAAKAIADSLLTALVASAVGGWALGGTGIWVRQRDGWAQDAGAAP